MKYVIVIPAKNEEASIANTLESVARQTTPPELCVVMDDGSDDSTPDIIGRYAQDYPFIRHQRLEDKGSYSLGGHVVAVFNRGKEYIDSLGVDYDFIIKMDADLSFDSDIMATLAERLSGDDQWGVISGTPYYYEGDRKIYEISPEWHSHGQFKVYRKAFLDDIGGIPQSLGWDSADNILAMEKGWKTKALRDVHYQMARKVGGKSSLKKGRINHGIGSYLLGYNFGYFLLKATHDLFKPPLVLGSLYMTYGYFKALLTRKGRLLNKQQAAILRSLLWDSFFSRLKNKDFILFQSLEKSNSTRHVKTALLPPEHGLADYGYSTRALPSVPG